MKKNIILFALVCLSSFTGVFGSAEKSSAEYNPLTPELTGFTSSTKASAETAMPHETSQQQAARAKREANKKLEDVKKMYKNLLTELDANANRRDEQNIQDLQASLANPYYTQALERLSHEPKWGQLVKRAKTKYQRYYHQPLIPVANQQSAKSAAE